jgi:hypothetical protein
LLRHAKKIPMSRSIEAGAHRKTGGFAALQSMADQPNLDEALKEALESRGVLNRLKAKVRAEIYKLVDHFSRVSTSFDFVSSGFSFFVCFFLNHAPV